MAKQIKVKELKIEEYEFVDVDGNHLFSVKFCPSDLGLAKRGDDFIKWFNELNVSEESSVDELEKLSDELVERLDTFLGVKDSSDIRDLMNPFTPQPNGELYIEIAIRKIADLIESELDVRMTKVKIRVKKYTEKYAK